jgi:hypothetical protein
MGRAILKGSAFGIPLVFVILFLIDMFAGLSVPLAASASIPAVIFGAFIGSAYYRRRPTTHGCAPGTTEPSADRS